MLTINQVHYNFQFMLNLTRKPYYEDLLHF